jgi:hypothetical protein
MNRTSSSRCRRGDRLRDWLNRLGAGFRRTVAVGLAFGVAACSSSSDPSAVKDEPPPPAELSEDNQRLARGCLAAVEIRGQNRVTIQETVESVFTGAGLSLMRRTQDEIVFERHATRSETAAYGSWFDGEARTRLKVEFMSQNGGVFFLRCRSYIAREAGTPAEDEQPLARRRVRDYEGLLYEVANRLN